MGELILGKKIVSPNDIADNSDQRNSVSLPSPLITLWERGFLKAHYTSNEVHKLLEKVGDLEQYRMKPVTE